MFDFSMYVDLPLIWAGIIAGAIILYVLLDGFDLGVGILFPFAPSHDCRNKMMNSIAPFWDGNETWLVLGGAGLMATFPLAYSIIMPALYVPIILMLLGLIFRGVAFEFRFKADRSRKVWDYAFHYGSIFATFFQGVTLGAFVQGIHTDNGQFVGSPFDWLTALSVTTGVALLFGYALLGSTWLIIKTEGITHNWAIGVAKYSLVYVMFFMGLVSLWVPLQNRDILYTWLVWPKVLEVLPFPVMAFICSLLIYISLSKKEGGHIKEKEYISFICTILIFLCCFAGMGICIWPFIVPSKITIWQAASAPESLSLMLVGAAFLLPVILSYTVYSYYVFRGKTHSHGYY